jgi:hypothetical protein
MGVSENRSAQEKKNATFPSCKQKNKKKTTHDPKILNQTPSSFFHLRLGWGESVTPIFLHNLLRRSHCQSCLHSSNSSSKHWRLHGPMQNWSCQPGPGPKTSQTTDEWYMKSLVTPWQSHRGWGVVKFVVGGVFKLDVPSMRYRWSDPQGTFWRKLSWISSSSSPLATKT